jgi:hypothetical protein
LLGLEHFQYDGAKNGITILPLYNNRIKGYWPSKKQMATVHVFAEMMAVNVLVIFFFFTRRDNRDVAYLWEMRSEQSNKTWMEQSTWKTGRWRE